MRGTSRLLAAALLPALVGCAAIDPRAGLGRIESLVQARAALPVSLPADAAAERTIDATVDALLRDPLTVDAAVRIALLNNRGLRALYQELGVAEAELVQAGLLPNPVLNAKVRFGLGPSGTGAELGVVQELIGVLQIPLKKRVAAAKRETALLETADAVLNLALDVKAAFYRTQGALQMIDLRRHVVAVTQAARTVAERQHAAGNISDLDLASAQAAHEESRIEIAAAESAALADREDLNVLLGLFGERTTWTIAARLPDVPEEVEPDTGLERLAITQRLDLEAARLRGDTVLAEYGLGRFYGLVPSGALGPIAERELEGTWSVGPALAVPLPLFDQNQAELAGIAARLRSNDERRAALAVRIRAEVRRARLRVAASRARARHYGTVVLPLQTRVVAESQREYNAMLIGVFPLLQARRDQVEAGRRYVETLTEYWLSRTELERSLGGELDHTARPAPDGSPATAPAPDDAAHPQHHHGG